MRKGWAICVTLIGVLGAVVAVALILHEYVRAEVLGGPLPAPPLPREIIQLTPVEKLGKLMLYDSTLSDPPGYSCATCHVPETGFTGPNSEINASAGPQPGIVPGRFSDRKPQSYLYAAFSPEGPYYDPHHRTGNFGGALQNRDLLRLKVSYPHREGAADRAGNGLKMVD